MSAEILQVRWLDQQAYTACWQAMQTFTQQRNEQTLDEIWLVEHPAVFTQGQNGKAEHILNPGDIPIIKTDRGGQVTYHGPGQLMLYTLIDIKRKKMNIRDFVCCLEKAVIAFLHDLGISAKGKREAPGVYVNNESEKICSIGLRVKRGASYHGLAFNLAMDLEPFTRINPCGFSGLKVTQLTNLLPDYKSTLQQTGQQLTNYLSQQLGYTTNNFST